MRRSCKHETKLAHRFKSFHFILDFFQIKLGPCFQKCRTFSSIKSNVEGNLGVYHKYRENKDSVVMLRKTCYTIPARYATSFCTRSDPTTTQLSPLTVTLRDLSTLTCSGVGTTSPPGRPRSSTSLRLYLKHGMIHA